MILSEIFKVSKLQTPKIDELLSIGKTKIGVSGKFDIYKAIDSIGQYYLLFDQDDFVGYLGTSHVKRLNKLNIDVVISKNIFISPKYRGHDLGSILYRFVFYHENLNILSDEYQTEDGIKLWNRLITRFNVKIIDRKNHKILDYQDEIPIYGNNKYLLIMLHGDQDEYSDDSNIKIDEGISTLRYIEIDDEKLKIL